LLGAPADVLSRRPDVRRDIARLEAADARTSARVRDRLPRLTLTATAGTSALSAGALFSPSATVLSAAGGLIAPIIDFGRRKALVDQAAAQADERAAILQTTVLTAIREIERDAAAVNERGTENAQRLIELNRNRTAQLLLRSRYTAGLQDFSGVLDAERQAVASAESELSARAAALNATLSLWKSLGG
jgi:outer membrane protein, multidrug efflux system